MPTGYTAEILDGNATNAQEFAKVCAHAFMWNMRDIAVGSDLRLPERHDSYYEKELHERLAELSAWDKSTEEEKYAQWSEYADEQAKRRDKARAEANEAYEKLIKVRKEVASIPVPETHRKFKEFMLQQIDDTIRYEGTFNDSYYKVQPYVEWVESQRGYILRSIERFSEALKEAEERHQQGREWVSTLANLYGLEVKD